MNGFLKSLCTVLIAFVFVLGSVNAVSASADTEYEDYIKSFARKDAYVVDDTIFVDYYINDSGEIDDVVRLTYVKGVPTYLVEIINNEIV